MHPYELIIYFVSRQISTMNNKYGDEDHGEGLADEVR